MKLTEDYIEETFADFIEQNYHTEKLTEGNVVWIFEHEYVPALFEFYLEETYEISSLNEENTSNIYENEFIPALMKAYSLDESVNPGSIAGAVSAASTLNKRRTPESSTKEKKEDKKKKEMKESSAMDIYTSFLELQEKRSGSLRSHKKMKDKKEMDKVGKKDDPFQERLERFDESISDYLDYARKAALRSGKISSSKDAHEAHAKAIHRVTISAAKEAVDQYYNPGHHLTPDQKEKRQREALKKYHKIMTNPELNKIDPSMDRIRNEVGDKKHSTMAHIAFSMFGNK